MTRRHSPAALSLLHTRATAAKANNPRISPRELAEQTGMTVQQACGWLETGKVAA